MQNARIVAFAVAFVATPALAQDKAACLDAAERAQRLRANHKLVEAQSALRVCASEQCPVVLRVDCAGWLAEVDKAVPSVVLAAKDGAGADLVDVAVTVDGQPLAQKLDGTSIALNAGSHVFRFATADGTSVERQLVVREGEKSQSVGVVLATPVATAPVVPAVKTVTLEPPPSRNRGSVTRIVGWTGVGVGVLAAGIGLGLYVSGGNQMGNANCGIGGDPTACRTDADTSAYDAGANLQGAGIGLLVGGVVAVAAGVVLVLVSRSHAPADVARAARGLSFAF